MDGLTRTACVLGGLVMLGSPAARAEGEYGPMFGGALVAAQGPDDTEIAGIQGELALWRGPIGLAVEAARQWSADTSGPRVASVGASLRVLVLQQLLPSLLESRDVELGLELHGIIERTWWDNLGRDRDPFSYGGGIALRLRGGSDDLSNLLVESRLFVRVVASRWTAADTIARGAMPGASDREYAATIGLGASFGGGDPGYAQRFRPHPLDALEQPVR